MVTGYEVKAFSDLGRIADALEVISGRKTKAEIARLREVLEEICQHLEDGDDSGAHLIVRHELKKVIPHAT